MSDHGTPRPGGLALDRLVLVPHDPQWEGIYSREAARLRQVPGILTVEHIGSTALPDILSKPVVDIAATAVAFDDPAVRQHLMDRGYACHGDYGLPGRIFYTLGSPPFLHLHVVSPGSVYWTEWLTFRDRLRQDPELRRRYEAEKVRLVAATRGDRKRYTEQKTPFIRQVLDAGKDGKGTS